MKKIEELKAKRAKVWETQKAINDKAKAEKRDFTAEEQTAWDAADVDFNKLSDEIKAEEQRMKRDDDFRKREDFMKSIDDDALRARGLSGDTLSKLPELAESRHKEAILNYRGMTGGRVSSDDYLKAYRSYLVGGIAGQYTILTPDQARILTEVRALQADIDTTGGFLVAPEQMIMQLIMAKDDLLFIRRRARVFPVPNAASLGAPSLDANPDDPVWTAEIATGNNDTGMRLGKRELHPHPLAKRIKVSKKLARVSLMNIDALVRDRLAYKFATVEENAYLNGNGSNQPLGVFVNSTFGITSARDVSTQNTATAITAEGLINAKYKLTAQYRRDCSWCFHRDALKMIRKLKTGEGDYLWRQGIATDKPDTILDLPYDESEYAPNTFTTGLYVGILADWSFYWIADALNMQIQVLTELYAETNENGYIGRAEIDGMPAHENAFVRVKLG